MRLQCCVCKRHFDHSERFVELTSWVKHSQGGVAKGISLAVCKYHLPVEMVELLLLHTDGFSGESLQNSAERWAFNEQKEGER